MKEPESNYQSEIGAVNNRLTFVSGGMRLRNADIVFCSDSCLISRYKCSSSVKKNRIRETTIRYLYFLRQKEERPARRAGFSVTLKKVGHARYTTDGLQASNFSWGFMVKTSISLRHAQSAAFAYAWRLQLGFASLRSDRCLTDGEVFGYFHAQIFSSRLENLHLGSQRFTNIEGSTAVASRQLKEIQIRKAVDTKKQ